MEHAVTLMEMLGAREARPCASSSCWRNISFLLSPFA